MATVAELKDISTQVRRDIIRMVNGASSGHPGGSLDCADLFTALYFQVLEINPNAFTREGNGEDMFFLSNGHISPVWYSVLARKGYFPVKELATFRKLGPRLQGHPSVHDSLPGIRIASGSLGQGLSVALGAAQAKKINKDNHLVYVLGGDGELEEGQVWEAIMYAGAKKVDNIISIIDYNKVQIDGTTDDVCSLGDLKQRYLASGWRVLEMNGNDMKDTLRGLAEAKEQTGLGQPVLILMHTQMGYGVDFMCGKNSWHGKAPSDQEAADALAQLKETLGDY